MISIVSASLSREARQQASRGSPGPGERFVRSRGPWTSLMKGTRRSSNFSKRSRPPSSRHWTSGWPVACGKKVAFSPDICLVMPTPELNFATTSFTRQSAPHCTAARVFTFNFPLPLASFHSASAILLRPKRWAAHRAAHRYRASAHLLNCVYNAIDERHTIRRPQASHVIPAGACG